MAKVSFFTLNRPELPKETKSFLEPRFKGDKSKEITLTLRALDAIQDGLVQEMAGKKMLFYCGSPENNIDPKGDFPPLSDGGQLVELNDAVAWNAASLVVMQSPDREEDAYTFEEFIALAVTCPVAWTNILRWRNQLNTKALQDNPK